jgi:hypothetical protein
MRRYQMLALPLVVAAGCLSTPAPDNPLLLRPDPFRSIENPIIIAPGQPTPAAYAEVFERVLSVVSGYFEIAYSNRYDGRIICQPKIAPGLEQPWKTGSPDARERLLASLQTIRYRCEVQIRAAEQSGYQVQVTVYRELKDDPRPSGYMSGPIFRDAAPVDRQFQVVDPVVPTEGDRWIPRGRETALEEAILKKIRSCQFD